MGALHLGRSRDPGQERHLVGLGCAHDVLVEPGRHQEPGPRVHRPGGLVLVEDGPRPDEQAVARPQGA